MKVFEITRRMTVSIHAILTLGSVSSKTLCDSERVLGVGSKTRKGETANEQARARADRAHRPWKARAAGEQRFGGDAVPGYDASPQN
jgi:hypothetical protein